MSGCSTLSQPITEPQVAGFTQRLNEALVETDAAPEGALTMDDAVARAIRHNHAIRAKELEAALAESKVIADGGDMLPSIVADSTYYRRDPPQMSRSSGSTAYSTSSDTSTLTRDITLSWNILDFGLSYIRARQGLDKANQHYEDALLVSGRIAEETRSAFWRTAALEKMRPGMERLEAEVAAAMQLARKASKDSQLDPAASITFQRELLELNRELNQIHTSLAGADHELRQLIGLQGEGPMRLDHGKKLVAPVSPALAADEDIKLALSQRPEIRKHMYDLRITQDEVDATILAALPRITFSGSSSSDSTSYLLHPNWISWGSKVAGDLMRMARVPSELDVVESQERFHRQSALATAATIVMQVHVARARVAVYERAFRDAERSADMQRQLLAQVRASVKSGKIGPQGMTREKLETLLAEVRAILAYADLQAAAAGYATARGEFAYDLGQSAFVRSADLAPVQRQGLGGPVP